MQDGDEGHDAQDAVHDRRALFPRELPILGVTSVTGPAGRVPRPGRHTALSEGQGITPRPSPRLAVWAREEEQARAREAELSAEAQVEQAKLGELHNQLKNMVRELEAP